MLSDPRSRRALRRVASELLENRQLFSAAALVEIAEPPVTQNFAPLTSMSQTAALIVPGGEGGLDAALAPDTQVVTGETESAESASTAPLSARDRLREILQSAVAESGVPGLAAAIVDGRRITTAVAGIRERGESPAVATNDRFANGSTTKAMTATLAGVLVERRLIRWETTLADAFPEYRAAMRPEYRQVTLEQLLQHRGGIIADDDASPGLREKFFSYAGTAGQSRQAFVGDLLREPLPVPVGTFRYANGGYTLAAAMLERATRMSYEALMQRYVFRPLGLRSATFNPPVSDLSRSPTAPVGHGLNGQPVSELDPEYSPILSPAFRPAGAGLRMSVQDWARFVRVHLGQSTGGVKLVTNETLARLHRIAPGPQISIEQGFGGIQGYGAGWGTRDASWQERASELGPSIWHDGTDGFWYAEVEAFPEADFAVLIMTNTVLDGAGQPVNSATFPQLRQRLMEAFRPRAADSTRDAALRTIIAANRDEAQLPSLAAAVVVDGVMQAQWATGELRSGRDEAVNSAAAYGMGENTEAITATLAAIAVQRREIRWRSTIGQMFPELRGKIRPEYLPVTLEDLLNHRGGVGTIADAARWDMVREIERVTPNATIGRVQLIRTALSGTSPAGQRGEFVRSNLGYAIAGAMLERAAGRSYEQLLQARVFGPLAMTSAGIGTPSAAGRVSNPQGQDEAGRPISESSPRGIWLLSPADGVFMNLTDWGKLLQLQQGKTVERQRLLSAASLAKLHTPDPRPILDQGQIVRYGFGWIVRSTTAGTEFSSSGSTAGFTSAVRWRPGERRAVLVASNQSGRLALSSLAGSADQLLDLAAARPIEGGMTPKSDSGTTDTRAKVELPGPNSRVIGSRAKLLPRTALWSFPLEASEAILDQPLIS